MQEKFWSKKRSYKNSVLEPQFEKNCKSEAVGGREAIFELGAQTTVVLAGSEMNQRDGHETKNL